MRVLVVEDHAFVREAIGALVRSSLATADGTAPEVVEVGSMAEARAACGPFNLALLDLRLPGESRGAATVHAFVQAWPGVPVLALSGEPNEDFLPQLFAAGARGYVPKAALPPEVAEAMRAVAGGRRYLPPDLAHLIDGGLAAPTPPAVARLNERQLHILRALAEGCSDKEIARQLGISDETVAYHLRVVFRQLGVGTRAQAVAQAMQAGWIDLGGPGAGGGS